MDKLFDKDFVAKAIYGLISMLAVLLTMEEHPPAAGILFGNVFVLALAETYSATIVEIIAGQKRLDRQICDPPYLFRIRITC